MSDKLKMALAGMAVAGFAATASAQGVGSEDSVSEERVKEITICVADVLKKHFPQKAADIDAIIQARSHGMAIDRWITVIELTRVGYGVDQDATKACIPELGR